MAEEIDQQPIEDADETEVDGSEDFEGADADLVEEEPLTEEDSEDDAESEPEMVFSWEASEYVLHHKSKSWYWILGIIFAVLTGLAIFLHLWLQIAVILGAGGALAVYARKAPRVMKYELSNEGVHIDGALYPFADFRSFGVIPDEEWHSIDLEPAKRFNIRRVILFDTEDFDEIVGHLELHLPREDRPLDLIERITRYVRF